MNQLTQKIIGAALALGIAAGSALPAFAVGVTAPAEEPTTALAAAVDATDANGDGAITAADARQLAIEAKDAADPQARYTLRAASGACTADTAETALDAAGIGMYDRVLTANGGGFTAAEYSYYYNSVFFSYYQQAYYYDYSYGEGYGKSLTGFDYTASPAEQYTVDANGNTVSFAELFHTMTIAAMEQYSYFTMLARENELTLDDEDYAQIDETLASLKQSASEYQMTEDELMAEQYGPGMTTYVAVNILRDQLLAEKYKSYISEDIASSVTDAEIETQYKTDPSAYNTVSARVFRLAITMDEENNTTDAVQQQAAADAFIASVTDEASFLARAAELDPANFSADSSSLLPNVDYASLEQYIGEDAAKWCFSTDRKVGDMNSFATVSYVYVIMITSPAARNEDHLPSVRHILVTFDAEEPVEDGTTQPDGVEIVYKEDAEKLAQSYLAEYERGAHTEERFAELAEKYSEDTASLSAGGSGKEGGLYENIPKGYYVAAFEDWAYDPAREPGDTEIIETEYGYHVMYFVGRAEEPAWKAEIRETLAAEKAETYIDSLSDKYTGSAVYSENELAALRGYTLDLISRMMMGA